MFEVPDVVAYADWDPTPGLVHVAEGGNSKMALVWKRDMQGSFVEEQERNAVMLRQFDEAIKEEKVETELFNLGVLVAQAACNQRLGMNQYPCVDILWGIMRRGVHVGLYGLTRSAESRDLYQLKLSFLVRLRKLANTLKRSTLAMQTC